MSPLHAWLIISAGIGCAALAPFESRPWIVLGGWIGAGLAWVWAARRAESWELSWGGILAGALLLRIVAFVGDPGFSDDVYRYVWEGELVVRGLDPYATAPVDPALDSVGRDLEATRAAVNHPEVPAAYPPLTQYANALAVGFGHLFGGEEALRISVRALYALCDLLVLIPLAGLVRRAGRARACLIAWAWCPLVVIELGGAGHFDALGILLLVAALAAARGRSALAVQAGGGAASVTLLVLGSLTKLLPLGLLPFALRGPGARRRCVIAAAVFTLVVLPIAGLAPVGFASVDGLATYAFRWESTSLVHRFVEAPLGMLFAYDEGPTDPRRLARALAGIAWVATAGWLWYRRVEMTAAARILIGLFLILSPTLHPWYVTWIVPFLALRHDRAWAWLASAVPLVYVPLVRYRLDGQWIEPAWVWPVLALPFFTALLLDARLARRP